MDEEATEKPSAALGILRALEQPDIGLGPWDQTHGTLTTGEHPVGEIPDFSDATLQSGES